MGRVFEHRKGAVDLKVVLVFGLIVLAMVAVFITRPNITGFIVFSESAYTFDFSNSAEYTYNSSAINLSDNQAKLSLQTETITNTTTNYFDTSLSSATYDGNDALSKLTVIDGEEQEVEPDETFDITFSNPVNNSDVIGLYLAEKDAGTIYVCAAETNCDSPGYGSVSYDGGSGWYNITLSGLEETASSFRIRITSKIEFDFIKATYAETETTTTETASYPDSATVETPEITVSNLSAWETFNVSETLNGQIISYEYSTDSESSWANITPGTDLSETADIDSKKIRFRATLNSDTNQTPVLYSIGIGYETSYEPACEEDWKCSDWNPQVCPRDETQTRTCTDANSCGTEENKPAENQSCTYTAPVFAKNETSPKFNLTIPANETAIVNSSDLTLEIFVSEDIASSELNVTKANTTEKPLNVSNRKTLGKYQDIAIDENLKAKLSWAIIKIYYTEGELSSANLKEDSLKIYRYNETTASWDVVESFVNPTGKYVWANVTGFSTYGIFGESQTVQQELPEGGTTKPGTDQISGGGGGGSITTPTQPAVKEEESETEEKIEEPSPEKEPEPTPAEEKEEPAIIEEPEEIPAGTALSALAVLVSRFSIGIVTLTIIAAIIFLFVIYRKERKREREKRKKL